MAQEKEKPDIEEMLMNVKTMEDMEDLVKTLPPKEKTWYLSMWRSWHSPEDMDNLVKTLCPKPKEKTGYLSMCRSWHSPSKEGKAMPWKVMPPLRPKYYCANANCRIAEYPSDPNPMLKTCASCQLVKYCGKECQVQARPDHKEMCKKRRKDFQQRERMDLKDFKRFELKLKMSDDAMEFAEEKNDFFAFQQGTIHFFKLPKENNTHSFLFQPPNYASLIGMKCNFLSILERSLGAKSLSNSIWTQ